MIRSWWQHYFPSVVGTLTYFARHAWVINIILPLGFSCNLRKLPLIIKSVCCASTVRTHESLLNLYGCCVLGLISYDCISVTLSMFLLFNVLWISYENVSSQAGLVRLRRHAIALISLIVFLTNVVGAGFGEPICLFCPDLQLALKLWPTLI